jgi:hypothetical protein
VNIKHENSHFCRPTACQFFLNYCTKEYESGPSTKTRKRYYRNDELPKGRANQSPQHFPLKAAFQSTLTLMDVHEGKMSQSVSFSGRNFDRGVFSTLATDTKALPRYHLWDELLQFKFYQLFSFICCVGIFQIPQHILSSLRGITISTASVKSSFHIDAPAHLFDLSLFSSAMNNIPNLSVIIPRFIFDCRCIHSPFAGHYNFKDTRSG